MNPVEKKLLEFAKVRFKELCKEMNVSEKDVIISVRPKTREMAKVLSSIRKSISKTMNTEGYKQTIIASVLNTHQETVSKWIKNS